MKVVISMFPHTCFIKTNLHFVNQHIALYPMKPSIFMLLRLMEIFNANSADYIAWIKLVGNQHLPFTFHIIINNNNVFKWKEE